MRGTAGVPLIGRVNDCGVTQMVDVCVERQGYLSLAEIILSDVAPQQQHYYPFIVAGIPLESFPIL